MCAHLAEPVMTETPGGPEAGAEPGHPKDPVELLVTALNALAPADRDQVYAWILRRVPLGPPAAWPGDPTRPAVADLSWAEASRAELARTLVRQGGPGASSVRASVASGQQMVPVRFSSEQHAQLRQWCAEHGFSMATVIRGLVSRFLEGQLPGPAESRGPGERR
jgi:ParG